MEYREVNEGKEESIFYSYPENLIDFYAKLKESVYHVAKDCGASTRNDPIYGTGSCT